ncbi:hypothetical protein AB4084_27475, partial [Lysobacter sp. 2RAB21]
MVAYSSWWGKRGLPLALSLIVCAAAAPAMAKTPKVLFIGTDGFRGDVYGTTPTPNLDALVADGYL